MADAKEFAKELSALIKRYIDEGCDPQDVADEIAREANYVFGTTTSKLSGEDVERLICNWRVPENA